MNNFLAAAVGTRYPFMRMEKELAMYRFPQAAMGIGLTEPALRNWVGRNDVDLFGERPKGGWRWFSENDVFVLAVAAELVRFGAKVQPAVDAAREGLAFTNFSTWEGLPNHLYAAPEATGRWVANSNRELVLEVTGALTLVELNVPRILQATRVRLAQYAPTPGQSS